MATIHDELPCRTHFLPYPPPAEPGTVVNFLKCFSRLHQAINVSIAVTEVHAAVVDSFQEFKPKKRANQLINKPHYHPLSFTEDHEHVLDLRTALNIVPLIDARHINPKISMFILIAEILQVERNTRGH